MAVLALLLTPFDRMVRGTILTAALLGGVLTYGANIGSGLAGMRAINQQQGEMARFAKDFVKAPVAVNDLGYVAWANPDYVLDLFGLASADALNLRLSGAATGWADPLAETKGVRVAMIYDHWVGDALGPGWVRMGQSRLFSKKALTRPLFIRL